VSKHDYTDGTIPARGEVGQRESLIRLIKYLLPLKHTLALGILFTLLWSVVSLLYGLLVKYFAQAIETQVEGGTYDLTALNFFTALALVVFTCRGLFHYGMHYCWNYASQKLSFRLRNELFAHLQRLPLSFFDQRKTGQLISSIGNDIPAINTVMVAIQDSIASPVIIVGGVGLLFWLNWQLALVSCLCLPPTAWLIVRASDRGRRYQSKLQSDLSRITDHAEETISGVRAVKAFGNEEYEVQRFRQRSDSVFRSVMRTVRVRLALHPTIELLGAAAIIIVLWVGGRLIILSPDRFQIEDLLFFALVLQQVATGARNFGNVSVNLSAAGAAASRVFTLLDVQNDITEKPEAIPLRNIQGHVEFRNVSFAYSPGIPVLEDITFTMTPGEVVALVGPTGSGKTTIAALIPRFYDPRSGSVKIDGIDIRDCVVKELRDQIGIVPQETILFAGTIRENIAYGRMDASEEEVIAAARMANAWEFIERLPEGLDTLVGERGTRLSGGQRQRIAIARAVLRNPRILILDEATSSLDATSEALVQDAMRKLVQARTTLVIAHRLSTIRHAHTILVVKDGHIVETGRHEELLKRNGLYSNLYRTQFRVEETTQSPQPI
jgi:ATP-binding cassette, subfamily B, bacterial MsbA